MRIYAILNEDSICYAIIESADAVESGVEIQTHDSNFIGKRYVDGTFEDVPVEPIEPQPSIEERILFETEYQTMLLESVAMGGM